MEGNESTQQQMETSDDDNIPWSFNNQQTIDYNDPMCVGYTAEISSSEQSSDDNIPWSFVISQQQTIDYNDPVWMGYATPRRISSSSELSFFGVGGNCCVNDDADTYFDNLPAVEDYWCMREDLILPYQERRKSSVEVIYISSDEEESIDFKVKDVDSISISSSSSSDSCPELCSSDLHFAVDSNRKSEDDDDVIGILSTDSNVNLSLDGDDDVFCENENACVRCGADLGHMNPRQLCGKTFCYRINY